MLTKLILSNFRCHQKYQIDVKKLKLALIGPNGSGKTSVLEAIYLLAKNKTFKDNFLDLVKFDQDWMKIEAEIDQNQRIIKIKDNQKIVEINNKKFKRLNNQQKMAVILFEPDDLNLIKGSPNRRRAFFDKIISQYEYNHSRLLTRYQKVLRQRNDLIKTKNYQINPEELFSWNILLSQYGGKIIKNRLDLIAKINQKITDIYQEISNKTDQIELKYSTEYQDQKQIEQQLFNQLASQDDYYLGTTVGPHRDDFLCYFNNYLADRVCSRGENRSLILALKISETEIIKQILDQKPLILLDDVLSELDQDRRQYLMKYTNDCQIFLTSTEVDDLNDYQIIRLKNKAD